MVSGFESIGAYLSLGFRSVKMCSRTLPLFCTGESFFMLDAVNAGHSLKTSPVAEISRECYFA